MPDTLRTDLYALLTELEQTLREAGLWEATPPPPDAFLSTVPFSADRMDFNAWLQWVFLARFRALLEGDHPLPGQCDVAPMAEEALKDAPQRERIIHVIARIDALF